MAEPRNTIHVDIVSAEGEIFSRRGGDGVRAGAREGELGIAPRHAPLLTLLKAGEVRVQTADGASSNSSSAAARSRSSPTR